MSLAPFGVGQPDHISTCNGGMAKAKPPRFREDIRFRRRELSSLLHSSLNGEIAVARHRTQIARSKPIRHRSAPVALLPRCRSNPWLRNLLRVKISPTVPIGTVSPLCGSATLTSTLWHREPDLLTPNPTETHSRVYG